MSLLQRKLYCESRLWKILFYTSKNEVEGKLFQACINSLWALDRGTFILTYLKQKEKKKYLIKLMEVVLSWKLYT